LESSLPIEQSFGIEFYSTDNPRIGGRLKESVDDFLVSEITQEGRILEIVPSPTSSLEIKGKSNRFITMDVQKSGLTTMDVSFILASELKLPRQMVTYAGLKDKQAVTVQQMSIPSSASSLLQDLSLSRISLSNLEYTRHPIQIGDLWGNRFTIHLIKIESEEDVALQAAGSLTKHPLMNYFGVQRFGVLKPPTHLIGRELVKGDFEEAIRIMLTTTNEYEREDLVEVRTKLSESFEFNERILDRFPESLRIERQVISFLIKNPGEYERAISRIPPRIQTLIVHSYQSYLFNRLLSMRMKQNLPIEKPIVGDFVMRLDRAHAGRDSWSYVTEKNLESTLEGCKSGLFGLVCPIPGYSTKTPSSAQIDILMDILHDEGLKLQDFRKPRNRYLDSGGGFHLASISLHDLDSWTTDRGIVLQFTLRKGSYATVVMREIMRNHPINRI
jgi:tRNA pseudouridine13 synthase